MTSREHRVIEVPDLPPPRGYAHAVAAAPGRMVFLGGQLAHAPDGSLRGETVVEQFDLAARNLIAALRAAGGDTDHLVSLLISCTDLSSYRDSTRRLGEVWRALFGRWYPATTLIGVDRLFEPGALVELTGVAVIP